MILAAILLQAAPTPAPATPPVDPQEARFERCADIATGDGVAGQTEATRWALSGGNFLSRQCLGLAYAAQAKFAAAASAFEDAARGADTARDSRAANLWAQAGNAWLAAGDPATARARLDTALKHGSLSGLALGEAHLDRARALVAGGDTAAARADIDAALVDAAGDPLAWLLSATLARRSGDVKRAQADIAQALERAADDASVQLEAGNIAALSGDEAGARGGWNKAVQLGGSSPIAGSARAALAQFETGK